MAKYYIAQKGQRLGPFELGDLLSHDLTGQTYVWTKGMKDWARAKDVNEVAALLDTDRRMREFTPPGGAASDIDRASFVHSVVKQPHVVREPENNVKPADSVEPAIGIKRNMYYGKFDGKVVGPLDKCRLAMHGLREDTPVMVYDGNPEASHGWMAASSLPELDALLKNEPVAGANPPESFYISIMAQGGFNTTNGHLCVFDDYITLRPSRGMSVMIGNMSKTGYVNQYYPIEDIIGLKKGFMARRYILFKDGTKLLYGTFKSSVNKEIEKRQKAYFESHGLIAPTLLD